MPFTFAHPAIVVPLKKFAPKCFSTTGLVLGSMLPDFEYFIRMKIKSEYSHTLAGVFWFDLPLGIIVAFIFHNIVRNLLIENLPIYLKSKFYFARNINWNQYFIRSWHIVIFSFLIGIGSHILWDAFTHKDGYFVTQFLCLQQTLSINKIDIPVIKLLQHCSTIIGGLYLMFVIAKLPSINLHKNKLNYKYWFSVLTFGMLIFVIRVIIYPSVQNQIGNLIVTAIAATLLSLMLVSLYLRLSR